MVRVIFSIFLLMLLSACATNSQQPVANLQQSTAPPAGESILAARASPPRDKSAVLHLRSFEKRRA